MQRAWVSMGSYLKTVHHPYLALSCKENKSFLNINQKKRHSSWQMPQRHPLRSALDPISGAVVGSSSQFSSETFISSSGGLEARKGQNEELKRILKRSNEEKRSREVPVPLCQVLQDGLFTQRLFVDPGRAEMAARGKARKQRSKRVGTGWWDSAHLSVGDCI